MPLGHDILLPASSLAASNEQSLQGLAERTRKVEQNTVTYDPKQSYLSAAKWTDALPAVTVNVEDYQPGVPGTIGNPFMFWEVTFDYDVCCGNQQADAARVIVKDSIELPNPSDQMEGLLNVGTTRSSCAGAPETWRTIRFESTTAWVAQTGAHVLRLGVYSLPSCWIQLRNVRWEVGVL